MHPALLGSRNPNFPPEEEDKEEKGNELMRCESTQSGNKAGYAIDILWDNTYAQKDQRFIVNYSKHGTV